jgi:GNAT superfamily N-acetyltransferase
MPEKFKTIPVRTFYLEMKSPFPIKEIKILPEINLIETKNIDNEFYLFLYNRIGAEYGWSGRLRISEEELKMKLSNPNNFISVLYFSGVPAGFFEIEKSGENQAELVYFGLSSDFQGKGLGGYLINEAKRTAKNIGVTLFWLHTCEFDSSAALSFYRKNGFEIFEEKTVNEMYPTEFLNLRNFK